MVTVKPPNKAAVYRICSQMREVDKREIYPLCHHDSPLILAQQTMYGMTTGRGKVIWADGLPVALCGVHPEFGSNHHYRVFAFGTADWKKAVYVLMRELRRMVREVVNETGAMRMQADSHEEHTEAHSWMERMGGKRESVMKHYGKNGETYHRYVWLRDDLEWALDANWRPYSARNGQMDIEEILEGDC